MPSPGFLFSGGSMSLFSQTLRTSYSSLWTAAQPLLRRHKRLQHGFEARLVPPGWPGFAAQPDNQHGLTPLRPPLWIQAASGGESTLVPPLVEAVRRTLAEAHSPAASPKNRTPNGLLPVLATTCTRQGMDILEKNIPRLVSGGPFAANYFPLDSPPLMAKAFRQSRANYAVLLETELWPGFMHEAARAGVPYAIINARMTEKTFAIYQKFRTFFKAHAPAFVAATTQESADRFSRLFPTPVLLMPNIKFDLAHNALETTFANEKAVGEPAYQQFTDRAAFGIPSNLPLALLASVRKEEESLLVPGLSAFLQTRVANTDACLVIAPRHLERVPAWELACAAQGIPYALRSHGAEALAARPRVIIWDVFGELATVYGMADAVFVGGSLAPLGGQNFLEALAAGHRPVTGPSWHNFAWVGDGLFSQGLVAPKPDAHAVWGALAQALALRLAGLDSLAPEAWDTQRAEQSSQIQESFVRWLTPLCGGSKLAGELVAEKLLLAETSPPEAENS